MLTLTHTRAIFCLMLAVAFVPACGDDASVPTDASILPADAAADAVVSDAALDADMPDAAPDAAAVDSAVATDAALDAPVADTWTAFAEGFFTDYCVSCHTGGTRDYRTIAEVMRDSSTIACGVNPDTRAGCTGFPPPGQFPVGTGPKPSDAERRRLVAWIDASLPE